MSTEQWALRTDSLTPHLMNWGLPLSGSGPRGRSEQLRFRTSKRGMGTPTILPVESKYLSPLCRSSPQILVLSNLPTILGVEGISVFQLRKLGLSMLNILPKVTAS